VKFVLEATLVYWISLAYIPKAFLDNIRKKCFNYERRIRKAFLFSNGIPLQIPKTWEDGGLNKYICMEDHFP
jgi:hypothetical protein